jgi:hypothetical protein
MTSPIDMTLRIVAIAFVVARRLATTSALGGKAVGEGLSEG